MKKPASKKTRPDLDLTTALRKLELLLTKSVADAKNLSRARRLIRRIGYANGRQAAYDLGYANGRQAAYDLGYANGRQAAYDLGYANGADRSAD